MIRRRTISILLALATVAAGVLAASSPAMATPRNPAQLVGAGPPVDLPGQFLWGLGGCIQPVNGSLDSGAAVVQEPCDDTNLAQHWEALDGDEIIGDVVRYQNVSSHLCLDAFGPAANGTRIIQWPCNSISNERWQHIVPWDMDDIEGPIVSRVSGTSSFCLDVPNASEQADLQVQIFRCNGTNAQVWTFFWG